MKYARSAQFAIDEILAILRRRRRLFVIPCIVVVVGCTVGAFVLPRKYESSTTILVQRDEILNPLVSYTMAVSLASEDRLRSLKEIIFAQSTIDMLIDTLGLSGTIMSPADHDELSTTMRKNIDTESKGNESFILSYQDTDPRRACAAVAFLAARFITTRLSVETQRNDYAVQFYERKLEELREKFEGTQHEMITSLKQRIGDMPVEGRVLQSRVDEADVEIGGLDQSMRAHQRALSALRTFPGAFDTDQGRKDLVELQRAEIPFAPELRTLLAKYDDVAGRYTPRYPEVEKLRGEVLELLQRMAVAVESETARLQSRRWEAERRRSSNIQEMQRTTSAEQQDQDKVSNFSIYQKLYDEMKVKLEQARTTRDLAKRASNQFIIIDPPRVPVDPSKPNRVLIVLGGLGLGLFLGALAAGIGELTDTRLRTTMDFEVYEKPIIAFLPDGRMAGRA